MKEAVLLGRRSVCSPLCGYPSERRQRLGKGRRKMGRGDSERVVSRNGFDTIGWNEGDCQRFKGERSRKGDS